MTRALESIGRFAARRPLVTIAGWLALSIIVIGAASTFGRQFEDSLTVPGADSQRAVELLDGAGAAQAGLTAQVVLTPTAAGAAFTRTPAAMAAARKLRDRLATLPNVIDATDPAGAVSPDGRIARVSLQYPVMEKLDAGDLEGLRSALAAARDGELGRTLQVEAGGDLFFAFSEPESGLGELAGIAAAAIILLVAFGSLIAMGLPIVLALFGLALGVGAMPLIGHLVEIPSWAPMMASMVGLGVGIDYALLLVTRHRENLASGMSVEVSAGRAVATAGRSVVFAGGTVLVSILGLSVAGIPFLTAAGIAISVVVLVMVSASVTLLPALLGLAGRRINRLTIGLRRPAAVAGSGRWERWAAHVTRHARPYLIVATVFLLAIAAPVLALRLGVPDDETLPQSRTERRAYDLVAAGFGPGTNGPLVVAVDISADGDVVEPLRRAIAADPGIASVSAASVNADAGVASIVATPTTSPQDQATQATVDRLRGEVLPAALGRSRATAHVGGQTAAFGDMSGRVEQRLPVFIAAVVVLSMLLLMLVFRSILVPLKAALLNLLGVGAAYGVLVMVFQWGWGASLIGLESTVPIVSFIPMFMFAIVFGLSMDYEVFLLSRIREHYLAGADNDEAVVRGLASTARVITSAALIMVSVFLGFVASNDPTTKMFGLGLATAIFVDATIIRLILVPAAMTLMGDANWWLPRWLDRTLPGGHHPRPTCDIGGAVGAGETP